MGRCAMKGYTLFPGRMGRVSVSGCVGSENSGELGVNGGSMSAVPLTVGRLLNQTLVDDAAAWCAVEPANRADALRV